jgi:2,3-bisphosphoglycerate-independent phosphoglycerate mutase
MKYCVLIIDGAAGLPLPEREGKTCLELASAPNLDAMAESGYLGLARTVPTGMEPGSAPACMSVMGYDPEVYYRGRAAIEARSMGIDIGEGEVVFRCNLVSVRDGKMHDYSAGHITTAEASEIIRTLNENFGSEDVVFFPGVNYRHILKLRGYNDTLEAECTPPHDILGRPVAGYLPNGTGSEFLRDLMVRSEVVLKDHPVNRERVVCGQLTATGIWLFWGCGQVPDMPSFQQNYGASAAMTSGVDLLRGLAYMASMDVLEIPGVTDGPDNDYVAQISGAMAALETHDLVIVHIEAPDEAAHSGSIENKIDAIQRVDSDIVSRLREYSKDDLRVLVMPDHPTPIALRTHTADPVPFMLWGKDVVSNGARRFTEAEAGHIGVFIEKGYKIMSRLLDI